MSITSESNDRMRQASVRKIVGPTILLGSGTYFDFLNPADSNLQIEDVAYGLAYACRFAGQCVNQTTGRRVFYSVAEHCVRMSLIVPADFAHDALLHELGEATCHDVTGPLKLLCPDYQAVEKRCAAAAEAKFGVKMMDPVLIKRFDLIMLATEKRDLMPAHGDSWSWLEGVDPLPDRIDPWTPDDAAQRFLRRYADLVSEATP